MSTVEASSGDWTSAEGKETGGYPRRHCQASQHRWGGSVTIVLVLRDRGVTHLHPLGNLT